MLSATAWLVGLSSASSTGSPSRVGEAASGAGDARRGRGPSAIVVAIVSYRRESRTGLVSVALMPGPPPLTTGRAEQDHAWPASDEVTGHLEAVAAGHVVVEQDQVVRRARLLLPVHGGEAFIAVRGHVRTHPPRQQAPLEDLAVGGVVVDDQHLQAREVPRRLAARRDRPACAR